MEHQSQTKRADDNAAYAIDRAPHGKIDRTALPAPNGEQLMIKDIDDARVIIIVASDLENDAPIVNLRVKKAVSKRGAKLIVVRRCRCAAG